MIPLIDNIDNTDPDPNPKIKSVDWKPCPRCQDKDGGTTKLCKSDGTVLYCMLCETDDEWQERKKQIHKNRAKNDNLQRILQERACMELGLTKEQYEQRLKHTLHPHFPKMGKPGKIGKTGKMEESS